MPVSTNQEAEKKNRPSQREELEDAKRAGRAPRCAACGEELIFAAYSVAWEYAWDGSRFVGRAVSSGEPYPGQDDLHCTACEAPFLDDDFVAQREL